MKIELPFEQLAQAHEYIAQAKHIVITTHMAPDGDAMGSALAMWHFCQKRATVIVPNAFPAFLGWMPGAEEIRIYEQKPQECDKLIAEADLIICTDFNDPKRIGPMGEKMLANPCPKILIDHHLNPMDFADEVHSHPEASSSCEIVYKELRNEGVNELTTEIATCIYTGLMTDTGNFSYNSNNPEIYEIVASLLRAGAVREMVVIMPDNCPGRPTSEEEKANATTGEWEANFATFMAEAESEYRISAEPAQRAIAGLSMGGYHTMRVSYVLDGQFEYVAMFSPATFVHNAPTRPRVFWLAIGTEDFLWDSFQEYREWLEAEHIEYTYYESTGGHDWPNWQDYLGRFLPKLF